MTDQVDPMPAVVKIVNRADAPQEVKVEISGVKSVAAKGTATVLKAKGYHHRFVFSQATGHCDKRVFEQTLADTLVWVWRGYKAE